MKLLVGSWERKFPDSLDFVFKCPDSSSIKMVAKEVKIGYSKDMLENIGEDNSMCFLRCSRCSSKELLVMSRLST